MTIETISPSNHSSFESDDDSGYNYLTPRMSAQERMIDLHRSQLMDTLELSTLSDDDKQRLRRLSADYAIALVSVPEADKNNEEEKKEMELLKRTILDYLSADIPELSNTGMMGLCRASSKEHPVTILIDGQPLDEVQLSVAYSAIKPSKEVLDRAVEDAAYFYVPSAADAEPVKESPAELPESQPDSDEKWDDRDIYEEDVPFFDKKHTVRDEIDYLAEVGGRVISMMGMHRPIDRQRRHAGSIDKQKIAS